MKITAVSASGAASDDYCGVNQEITSCEAIRDLQDPSDTIRCSNPSGVATDNLCGCHRDVNGACTDIGTGGLCRSINGANRCTIQCSDGFECTGARTCVDTDSPKFCG
jgi:hypothetical protein